jgi:hypothetical protein
MEPGVHKRHIVNPVRDKVDLVLRNTVNVLQVTTGMLAHHDYPVREPRQLAHGFILLCCRIFKHGVERGDHRRVDIAQ